MNRARLRRTARRGKDSPVSESLASARLPPLRRSMLKSFVEGWYAAHPERLSGQSLADEASDGGSRGGGGGGGGGAGEEEIRADKQFRIANGNDTLRPWLRDGLDADRTQLRFGTGAHAIARTP